MKNIFDKVIKSCIYLLVFFLPMFFLDFSFEVFEYNKQFLLLFLVSLGAFAWLGKMVLIDKEIRFKRTPLDLPVLAFLGVAVLSAIFSVDKLSSLFGFYGRFNGGLLGLLSCGALFFLITNNIGLRGVKGNLLTVQGMARVFLWSAGVIVAMSYLTIFGWWQKLSLIINDLSLPLITDNLSLPGMMLQSTFNPVAGSMEALAMFLAAVAVMLVVMILVRENKGELRGVKGLGLLLVAILGLLVIIDFAAAWAALAVSLLFFTGFALWTRMFRENVNKLLVPIFLIIIAGIFMVSNPLEGMLRSDKGMLSGIGFEGALLTDLPQEQVLGQGTSWKVAGRAMTENVKSVFLGSGIGAFHYDFTKFKPVEFNEHLLWQIRFDRAGNHIAEILGTMGLLGLLAWFGLIGTFLLRGVKGKLEDIKGEKELLITDNLSLPLMVGFGTLVAAQFVYYQNTVLMFMFWLVLGLSAAGWRGKSTKGELKDVKGDNKGVLKFSFKDIPEIALVFNVILMLIGLGMAGGYYQLVKFYRADMIYVQASQAIDLLQKSEDLEKAVELNPFQVQYKIVLARVYLNQVLGEMRKPLSERNQDVISSKAYYAISHIKGESLPVDFDVSEMTRPMIKGAAELAPNQVAVWETMGMIYRDIQGVAGGAAEWAINSFEKAIDLEPTNPVLRTELGKLYQEREKSLAEFEKAVELKPDYFDARLQIAFLFEREGNLEEAISEIKGLVERHPLNVEALFQLGRLYFNNEQTDLAIQQFQKVVSVLPTHSNALYSLGVAYESQGKKELALKIFRNVLELNPDNEDVRQKVEELQ